MTGTTMEPLTAAPYATGGGGVVLEHRYGATLLASLLARTPVPELGDDVTPTVVRLQASDFSPVDDLVVSGRTPDGGLRHVSIGVRRAPRLVKSEKESVSLVRSYLRAVTGSWEEVRAGRWRLVLAVAGPSSAVKQLDDLAVMAKAAPSEEVFRAKAGQQGRADEGVRGRLTQLDALVGLALEKGGVEAGDVTAGELAWRLLSCLRIRALRLEGSDTTDRTTAVTSLIPVTRGGTAAEADSLFGQLAALADDYAPAGAEVTEWMLRRDLSGFPLARSPSWMQAWRILDGLAGRLRDHTRLRLADSSAEVTLDRQDARQALITGMLGAGNAPATLVVLGEPDVGKSALSVRAARQLIEDGTPITSMSLGDLPATALELEERLGGSLTDVLGATATGTARLLLVDGAEAVLEGRSRLLTDVATAALRAGLGVVAVTRTDGAGAAESALRHATEAAGLGDVVQRHEVPRLSRAEISQVAAAFPSIARLASEPRAAWLLGRPGLVDLLLRAGAAAALPAGSLSEADVFAAIWHQLVRRGEVTGIGGPSPDAREQAMLSLARRRLLPASPGEPPDVTALPSLRSDGLLRPSGPMSAWSPGDEFASDLVRDLAIARLLITSGWHLLDQAGAPRWALRAVRLACQARLAAAGAGSELERTAIQAAFDELAREHGPRWAEVPMEALLTLGNAQDALTRAWPALMADQHAGLRIVVRLALQRYVKHGIGDVTVLEPLVQLAYCGEDDLGQHNWYDSGLGSQIRELMMAWLLGLIVTGSGPDELRQRVRDRILAVNPEPYDRSAVEALALLGPELDEQAEAFLRGLAAGGGHLAPVVESAGAALAMSAYQPALLLALTESYYITSPGSDSWSRSLLGGIRSHRGTAGGPLAAWHYGPFHRLLNACPVDTLALINRMLDHAAAVHAGGGPGHPAASLPGLDVELPGVGVRHCVGIFDVWRWYRGGTNAPPPCLSALLAVERFADQLLSALHIPAADVAGLLLRDCNNLAMPGLVAGLLIRHPHLTGNLLDNWLTRPELWNMDAARAASEGMMHVQGPDPADLEGRDRRRLSFRDVAAAMTVQAALEGDTDRLAALAAIGDELIQRARDLAAGTDDAEHLIATAEGWAAILHPENHHPGHIVDGGLTIEYQHPQEVAKSLAPHLESLDRGMTALRLQNTYTRSPARDAPADMLVSDLAAAQDLAENPPREAPVHLADPIAAVAAAAVVAHAQGRAAVSADDLRWSATILTEVASLPWADQIGTEVSIYPMGADRSAAAALPLLLLPAFDVIGLDQATLQGALSRSAAALPDEVRMAFARATSSAWTAPCGPAGASGECRHQVLWSAVLQGLRDCQLGRWDQASQRRLIEPLGEPFTDTLPKVNTDRLLVNRLTSPLIGAAVSARSGSCVAPEARDVLDALLAAHRRGAVRWAEKGYGLPNDQHGPAAARVLAEIAAAGDTQPLTDHVRVFTQSMQALDILLRNLGLVFTYQDSLRPALPEAWRAVMTAALDEIEAHPDRIGDPFWAARALGGLIPAPQLELAGTSPDDTLQRAQRDWPAPGLFTDLVTRWMSAASGQPEAVDALVELIQCGSAEWQAKTGLQWIEDLIGGGYAAVAGRCWHLTRWLEAVRSTHLDAEATARWRRIVDGLAAEGDSRAVRLQQAEE